MSDPTPQEVGNSFIRRLDRLLGDHKSLQMNIHGKVRQASLETLLAEQALLSLGIYWEAFLHDLVVAYVLDNPAVCLRQYEDRIRQSLNQKYLGAVSWVEIHPPRTLSRSALEFLLDPQGRNITVPEASKLPTTANNLIAARYAPRFSLSSEDSDFFDFFLRHGTFWHTEALVLEINYAPPPWDYQARTCHCKPILVSLRHILNPSMRASRELNISLFA